MLNMFSSLLFFFCLATHLWSFELKNFTKNDIDYQWDRKDKQIEALDVYVRSFQSSYEQLGLGKCSEHFHQQVIEEKKLAEQNPLNNRWLIAMQGDKIVGIAFFEFDNYPSIYIRELAVLPEYRKQGIGKELVMAPLRDYPIERISIVTRRVNQPAMDFFRALHFKESSFQHAGYDLEKYIGMEWVNSH